MRHQPKFLGRAVTVTALVATTAGGAALMAPAAHAAPSAPAPPTVAGYAPGTSMNPATGDGGDYWASDSCHYFPQAGRWWSDMCWVHPIDGNGRAVATQLALVPKVAPNLPAPAPFIMIETTDPAYSTIRVPTNPMFAIVEWVRQPVGGGPSDAMVFDRVNRGYTWIPMTELIRIVQQGGGPRYGFPAPTRDLPPEVAALQIDIINSIGQTNRDLLVPCRRGEFCPP